MIAQVISWGARRSTHFHFSKAGQFMTRASTSVV